MHATDITLLTKQRRSICWLVRRSRPRNIRRRFMTLGAKEMVMAIVGQWK